MNFLDELNNEPWYVDTYKKTYHTNFGDAILVENIKRILQECVLNFSVGLFGSVNWKDHDWPFGIYGWSIDTMGRLVVCVGDWWGYQEQACGDAMIWYHKCLPTSSYKSTPNVRDAVSNSLKMYCQKHNIEYYPPTSIPQSAD